MSVDKPSKRWLLVRLPRSPKPWLIHILKNREPTQAWYYRIRRDAFVFR